MYLFTSSLNWKYNSDNIEQAEQEKWSDPDHKSFAIYYLLSVSTVSPSKPLICLMYNECEANECLGRTMPSELNMRHEGMSDSLIDYICLEKSTLLLIYLTNC